MTETSYTAWDDKLYQWPPPDGWYKAADGRWWPEGHGPGPGSTATDQAGANESGGERDGADGVEADGSATDAEADHPGGGGHDEEAELAAMVDAAGGGSDGESDGWAGSWAADPVARNGSGTAGPVLGDPGSDGRAADAVDRAFDAVDRAFNAFGGATRADDTGAAEPSTDRPGPARGREAAAAGDPGPAADETMIASHDLLAGLTGARSESPEGGVESGSGGPSDLGAELAASFSRATGEEDPAAQLKDTLARGVARADEAGSGTSADRDSFDGEHLGSMTDLDALPPPMVPVSDAPPEAETPSPPTGRDEASGDVDAPGIVGDLPFPSGESPDGGRVDAQSTASFELPEDGLGSQTGPAAIDEMGAATDWADQAPDETMIAPQPGGQEVGEGAIPGPAATGQVFGAPAVEGSPWGAAPPAGEGGAAPAGSANPYDAPQAADWARQPYGHGQGGSASPYATGFDQAGLQPRPKGGFSRKVLVAGLGVILLLVVGVGLYAAFGRGGDDPAGGTGPGSLADPHPRTTGVELTYQAEDTDRRWIVEVLQPVRDASAETGATPEAGRVLAATRIRVRNEATDLSAPLSELRFNLVTAGGEVIEQEANGCSVGDDLDFAAALPPTGSVEGTACWQIPADALGGLLLGIESTEVDGRVHIALQ